MWGIWIRNESWISYRLWKKYNNLFVNKFQDNKIRLEKVRQPSTSVRQLDIFWGSNFSNSLQRPHNQKPLFALSVFSGDRGGAAAESLRLLSTAWKLGSWLHFICSFLIHSSHLEHRSGIKSNNFIIYLYGKCQFMSRP